ncbi:inclusion body family protein [Pectobacterium aroidearum]|uniref:inclusion body family protein n=1 Tax=Pectobacterium aroidearum TaxID=1201031 RepID=UPI0015DF9D01|nr:inclusion body family protein [Pectobacterium aroidearum]MBA0204697.1 inclusion body family protein [Pectobacterium aroidearum]
MSENTPEFLKSSHNVINIIVVIDTDRIVTDFKGKSVSQDYNKPTPIGHQYSYMVATNESVIKGSGTADLNVKANIDDIIRWTGISESCNSDSSVLVYNLPRYAGDEVFKKPDYNKRKRSTMEPGKDSAFPVSFTEQTHWFMQSTVNAKGTEQYQVQFGLYHRGDGGDQKLFGYFQWDPTITVKG